MKPVMIGVGALALAAVASGAVAQGKGHGGGGNAGGHGNPGGHGNAMRAQLPGGGEGNRGHASGAMAAAVQRHGGPLRAAAAAHGHGHQARSAPHAMYAQAHTKATGPGRAKGNGPRPHQAKPEARVQAHGNGNGPPHGNRPPPGKGPPAARAENAANGKAGVRVLDDGRRLFTRRDARPTFDFAAARRGLINGCPPGLARKNNGCRPPGLARQASWQPTWWGLSGLGTGSYHYNDGYLVRLTGDAIAGYVPLFGGALSIGNPWPVEYPSVAVPDYYVNYYDLGPTDSYRYADDVLYRVDPATSAITSIAGLLTGSPIQIGSPLPPGYDVYNVPYAYRGQYADGPDAWYRYSDGYIYRVDPTTRLVNAAIELIAS